jgi:hypothetical protein
MRACKNAREAAAEKEGIAFFGEGEDNFEQFRFCLLK